MIEGDRLHSLADSGSGCKTNGWFQKSVSRMLFSKVKKNEVTFLKHIFYNLSLLEGSKEFLRAQ